MAFGLGLAANGGMAVDTVEEARQQAIDILTIDGWVTPEEDPVRSVLVQRITDKLMQVQAVALDVYNMLSVFSATGSNLDMLTTNIGVFRKTGIPQVLNVQLTSINVGNGYTIPAGTTFVTSDGAYTFQLLVGLDIQTTDAIETVVQYSKNGNTPIVAGDKLVSQTYIPQLSDVTVLSVSSAGTADETDEALRVRFFGKVMSYIGTVEFMKSRISEVEGVRKVGVNVNHTAEVDDLGVPAYSTEFLALPVQGLDESQLNSVKLNVATAIANFLLPGMPTFGNTTQTVNDASGRGHDYSFTVPTTVQVEIFFTIGPMENGTFSDTNVATIKQNIMDYINGMDIGQDVSMTKLWGLVTPGALFDVLDYGIRRVGDENWQKGNLTIGAREAAEAMLQNITITPQQG